MYTQKDEILFFSQIWVWISFSSHYIIPQLTLYRQRTTQKFFFHQVYLSLHEFGRAYLDVRLANIYFDDSWVKLIDVKVLEPSWNPFSSPFSFLISCDFSHVYRQCKLDIRYSGLGIMVSAVISDTGHALW